MSRRVAAALAAALAFAAVWVGAPVPAHAHALLRASSPADGARVDESPGEMLLGFTEAVDPTLSSAKVLDASGQELGTGPAQPVAGQPTQLRVPLGALAEGVYTVTWRVTSPSDGHTTVGSVAFGVGVPAPAPAGRPSGSALAEGPVPTPAEVAGRWLFYAGAVILLGAAVVGGAVAASPLVVPRATLAAAWAAAAVGLTVTLADQVASAGTGAATFLSSSTGHRWRTQAIAVAVAGVAVAWAWRRRDRASLAAVGAGAAGAMLARALAGHARASSVPWFTVGTQWVHLVAVGVWVGGLFWLLVALRRGDPGRGSGLARRFSTLAGAALVVVAATGTARAVDEVGAWNRLLDTRFGLTLTAKVALFAGLVALGARSRRHAAAAPTGRAVPTGRAGRLRRLVRAEAGVAAALLGATALLAGLPPSASVADATREVLVPALTTSGHDFGTSVRVWLEVSPGTVGTNAFAARVEDYDSGEPVPARAVSLRFALQDRPDLAPPALELALGPDGRWRGTGSALGIGGRWAVTAVVATESGTRRVAMTLDLPGAESLDTPQGRVRCEGFADPSYRVTLHPSPDPPRAERTVFDLVVQRSGAPVTGAQVCLRVDMPSMQHPGVLGLGREVGPGRYQAGLQFSMTGVWAGAVVVTEPGREPVAVPVRFDVT